jgi:hypothetical protein
VVHQPLILDEILTVYVVHQPLDLDSVVHQPLILHECRTELLPKGTNFTTIISRVAVPDFVADAGGFCFYNRRFRILSIFNFDFLPIQ